MPGAFIDRGGQRCAIGLILIAAAAIWGSAPWAAAQLPGVGFSVTPQTLSFNIKGGLQLVAAPQAITVRVQALGHRPWRLTVVAMGDLVSAEGDQIPIQQVSWQGSPGGVFTGGAFTPGQPVLLAQGQGSKEGVLRFILKNRWEYAAGRYRIRLLFNITSP